MRVDGVESEPRPRRKEENLIAICLADRATYFNTLLHTLVRSTPPQLTTMGVSLT